MTQRVMIVDDAMELGRLLKAALEVLGAKLTISVHPSAEEAILDAGKHTVDLVVTDMRLPGMTGVDLIKRMRKRQPDLKVILISGLTDRKIRQQAEELGCEAFLPKPLEMEEFIRVSAAALGVNPPALVGSDPVAGEETPAPAPRREKDKEKPAEPPAADALAAETQKQLLENLCKSAAALGVVLLDEKGNRLVRSGDFPKIEVAGEWIPPLMTVMQSSNQFANMFADTHPSVGVTMRGAAFDLVMAPVNSGVVMVALKPGSSSIRLALALEEVLAVQPRLAATLAASPAEATDSAPAKSGSKTTAKPAPAPEPEPPAVPEDPAALAAFASLFGEGAAPAAPAVSDTDSFWEQAADQQLAKVNPDTISFDQAVQLGLAPDEPDKEK
ncbi:MAG TPA: response regulator [Anaerolineaceae bacterium]|nr:response regulator [Anaerolineaceae bacterium]HNS36521.1 response regulator [Anaerolineaceae bacterium]HNZ12752.1 response regulator [Anaerolineaceae bacterium]HOD03872.1 response regulator [Anaerolineaceae bacterium]HOG78860.1 response regulator [Anaerolineaceae bacterium]